MEKFTQGEWAVLQRNNNDIQATFVGVKIGGEYIEVGFLNNLQQKANAHLIAAAPDMYRALRDLLEAHRHVYGLDGAWDKEVKAAEAALAKADGEQQQ